MWKALSWMLFFILSFMFSSSLSQYLDYFIHSNSLLKNLSLPLLNVFVLFLSAESAPSLALLVTVYRWKKQWVETSSKVCQKWNGFFSGRLQRVGANWFIEATMPPSTSFTSFCIWISTKNNGRSRFFMDGTHLSPLEAQCGALSDLIGCNQRLDEPCTKGRHRHETFLLSI